MAQVVTLQPNTLLENSNNGSVLSARHRALQLADPEAENPLQDGLADLKLLLQSGDVVLAKDGAEPSIPTCSGCGCTEEFACEHGCAWVRPGLCTSCVGDRR